MSSTPATPLAATSGPARSADDSGVPRSIARVLDLFEIVIGQRTCNLTTAATTSGLTPTTALRYLRALEARGYVDRNDAGDFSPGPTIRRIAASLRNETFLERLVAIAQPHLVALAELTGESTYLALSDGRTASYVATAESIRAIRHVGWVGQDIPLDGSALGAALASPGTVQTRTGAIEPDITAMSRSLPTKDTLGIAMSIVGPSHRFGSEQITHHQSSLDNAVDALIQELHINGEDLFI